MITINDALEEIVEIIDRVVSDCTGEECEEFKRRVIEELNEIN